jgi:hypothetical protein
VNYKTDEGFGAGVLASFYQYNGRTAPYKTATTVLIFFTTKAVQSHRIDFDWVEVGDSPLRLTSRIQLDITKTANFCGYGHEVTCDESEAEDQADALGLEGEERDDFVRRYYMLRWIRPNAYVNARYRVGTFEPKLELLLGWRGGYFRKGDFKEHEPYPDSYYDQVTDGGEEGFLSVLQAGVMLDTRDNEPAPRRGYWLEATIRGAGPFFGSEWTHFGFNTTLRGYAPLVPQGKLTLASRTMFDGLVGDAHALELASPGGFKAYSFGGGDLAGRGIRLRRYIGKVKLMEQVELRWAFASVLIAKMPFEFTLLAFYDILTAAEEWSDLGDALTEPVWGTGGGLRIAWEQNFIIRFDLGFSPTEDFAPGVYIDVDNLF